MVLFGTVIAAITAFIVVEWLLRFIQSHTFNGFGWYRIALGGVILILLQTGWKGTGSPALTNATTELTTFAPTNALTSVTNDVPEGISNQERFLLQPTSESVN
jgi:hypothetical protein